MKNRLHITVNDQCNNNCQFCCDANDDTKKRGTKPPLQSIHKILIKNKKAGYVMFTSGEPTILDNFLDLVRFAKQLGYTTIGLTTNGRALSSMRYLVDLIEAGVNHFVISIHGATQKTHDGLTRSPGSFVQTIKAIENLRILKKRGAKIIYDTNTVVTRRNLFELLDLQKTLFVLGVHHVVFNIMYPSGRGERVAKRLMPRYSECAKIFSNLANLKEPAPQVFVQDLPPCIAERFGVDKGVFGLIEERNILIEGGNIITKNDIDQMTRIKGSVCKSCVYDKHCCGVWRVYIELFGWEEFEAAYPFIEGKYLQKIEEERNHLHQYTL